MQIDQPGPTAAPDVNGQSFDARFTDLIIKLIVVGFFAYLSLTLLAPSSSWSSGRSSSP